jgi:hypothetical protein
MAQTQRIWLKNLAFVGLCLLGLAVVSDRLLSRNRIPPIKSPDAGTSRQDDFQATVRKINDEFRASWEKAGLQHAQRADDLTIARRLSLGLCGTVPSVEEIRALEALPAAERTQWYVSHLLEDRRSADYLAERLARTYVGTDNGPFIVYRRRRFVLWLSDKLFENARYDQTVRELIADTGLWTSSPAVNFVTVTLDSQEDQQPDEIRLAARTSRAFLGMRMDCLQCHDENLSEPKLQFTELVDGQPKLRDGRQTDFHQFAAFFSEAKQTPTGIRDAMGKAYKFKYLNTEVEVEVPATTPFLPELLTEGGTRREQLARWVTHRDNKMFARAAVNRFWGVMVGRPLIEPIDDLPLDPSKYPPALETLAQDFIDHSFNVRRLIRLIAATEVFQMDSRADFEITEAHEDHWAAFPLSRLRPEQVAGSMIQASSLKTINADAHIVWQLSKFGQTNEFVKRYGDGGEDEFTDRGGTITQRLLMMNGELSFERSKSDNLAANAAARLNVVATDADAIEAAYLAILTRRPTMAEKQTFLDAFREAKNERPQVLEDLYWVLMNSTEFSWNH